MSTVFLAMDTVLERRVAVKLLAEHLAEDEAFVARFRREALSAATLQHPPQLVSTAADAGLPRRPMLIAMVASAMPTLLTVFMLSPPCRFWAWARPDEPSLCPGCTTRQRFVGSESCIAHFCSAAYPCVSD